MRESFVRSDHALPERSHGDGTVVFACFAKHIKIKIELFDVWCDVLQQLPNAVLWLLRNPSESENRIRIHARNRGVEAQIVFCDFVHSASLNFIRFAKGADIVLDTTVYGSHTVAVDALWAGLPMISCVGDCVEDDAGEGPEYANQAASRVAASMLYSLDVADDLVVPNLKVYARRMMDLALDGEYYETLRHKIVSQRHTAPMWNTTVYGEWFSRALLDSVHTYINNSNSKTTPTKHLFTNGASPNDALSSKFDSVRSTYLRTVPQLDTYTDAYAEDDEDDEGEGDAGPTADLSKLYELETIKERLSALLPPQSVPKACVGDLRSVLRECGIAYKHMSMDLSELLHTYTRIVFNDADYEIPVDDTHESTATTATSTNTHHHHRHDDSAPPLDECTIALTTSDDDDAVVGSDGVAAPWEVMRSFGARSGSDLPVIGLMITKDDHAIIREWMDSNMRFLDGIVM